MIRLSILRLKRSMRRWLMCRRGRTTNDKTLNSEIETMQSIETDIEILQKLSTNDKTLNSEIETQLELILGITDAHDYE